MSAVWTFLVSTAAIMLGVSENSLALIAFGAVGIFDFASDSVLIVHFRAMQRGVSAAHLEHIVIRIVTFGLAAVGAAAVIYSVLHLVDHDESDSSTASIVLAAVSVMGLTVLTIGKFVIAARLPSQALRADARLTGIGAVLAAITVAGTSADEAFAWWWADPTAALVIGIVAIILAAVTARHPLDSN